MNDKLVKKKPKVIFACGGPGVGKCTYVTKLRKRYKDIEAFGLDELIVN